MSRLSHLVVILLCAASCALAQDVQSATLVGTVTDHTGAVIPGATVTVTNTQTQVVSRGATNGDGAYYIPFLANGDYNLTIEAAGFKKYVRNGATFQGGQNPRIDVQLEVGSLTDVVEVTGSTPLLATDSVVVGGVDDAKTIHDTPMLQSKPQHLMYYMEGSQVNNDGTYHILGLPSAQINYTIDGNIVKQTPRSAIGEVNNSVTPPVDALMEAQVWTTGIPAELGHSAGGAYNMVTKSGTNSLHFATEERYIHKDFIHRQIFNQGATNTPFEYHNFDVVVGGPVYIPKVYDGRNKTFFFLAFRFDYDHEANAVTVTTPDQGMLNGNFAFGGLGYPIYDPKSITCANANGCAGGTGYTATPFAGNQIPISRFDPVTAKFLSLGPYTPPNAVGFFSTTGPNSNLLNNTHYLADKDGYIGRFDQQLGSNHKLYGRVAWNRYRTVVGRESIQYAWHDIDNTTNSFGEPEPIDTTNITIGDIYNFGPTLINEFRVAYQRRADTQTPILTGGGWAAILGIPGVGPQTFPGFVGASGGSSVTWTANPGGYNRTLQDDFEYADSMTKIVGLHTIKFGYQGIRMRENDVALAQPSGVYNFTQAGSGLPFTPNTGNTFASFLLGSVTSASFTTLLANYLPRWWSHQAFVQDDWRVSRNMTVSLGVRYSYETPTQTKYGFKSEFNPNVTDPLTGMMGSITHPKGTVYKSDLNNFTPRLGLAWNFRPKFVFRGSFGMFTVDNMPELGTEEYVAQAVVQQPSGNPFPAFYLSQGPGSVSYPTNASTGTANFVGTNYSGRNATYIDPNLRNPYTLTWSGGLQWEFHANSLAEVVYQGSSAVALTGTTNPNVLPQSIYNSTNTTLLTSVFANTQNSLAYPQFGTITETGNYGHSTYHALVTRVERRFNSGLSYNFLFTWSKNLAGTAGTGWQYYDWNLTKGPTTNDVKYAFVSQASYELPVGKGRHYMDRGGILNTLIGGWTILTIQSLRTGLPVNFTMAGSPFKYLPGETQPNIVSGQNINVSNYAIGNLWPQSTQNPFFNINAFSYPAAYTPGNAGVGIARAGGVWWPQYSLTKTIAYREKYRLTVRMDANNLFPETRAFLAPNATVNIASPQTFGKFASVSYGFSNWFTPNGNLVGVLRLEF
jgi:hypothetical protein